MSTDNKESQKSEFIVEQHQTGAESGYEERLQRQYGTLSIISQALVVDSAWISLGGSLTLAAANGGPPGIIFEFVAACLYYGFINASIAELSSAIPSSAGVYHFTYLTAGPRFGPVLSYFAGTLNFLGWLVGNASVGYINANIIMQIYVILHPDFVIEAWHLFVTFTLIVFGSHLLILFANRWLPTLQKIGVCLVLGGGLVTVIVVLAMPKQHASSAFVWTGWTNTTGWPNVVAFLTGTLNGAYTIGTPDSITHMTEEMPNPRRDMPKASAAQLLVGLFSGLVFVIAVLYGVTDFEAVLATNAAFPLAAFYMQATGSKAATIGLLLIVLCAMTICGIGCFLTTGRILWTLARDNAVPLSRLLGRASIKWSCPMEASIAVCVLATALGALRLASLTAFNDLAGSSVILTSISFMISIASHLLSGRNRVPPGPFWMGKWGYLVNAIAIMSIIVTDIFYCFPYFLPVTTSTMNYNAVILVAAVVLITIWWFVHASRHHIPPRLQHFLLSNDSVSVAEKSGAASLQL